MKINPNRIRKIKSPPDESHFKKIKGPILYWMSRDQRVEDNWALITATESAKKNNQPFAVIFCLQPKFLDATLRQYDFMLKGLEELETKLEKLNIPFFLELGSPEKIIPQFVKENNITKLISDFSPLKIKKTWENKIKPKLDITWWEVDSHNIVPCWVASDKQEYAAKTFRPKIHKLLSEYMNEFPKIQKQEINWPQKNKINWGRIRKSLEVNNKVEPVNWIKSGESEAKKILDKFISEKLINYPEKRNDPNLNGQSHLSPYLHFGQISAQRIALEVAKKLKIKFDGKSLPAAAGDKGGFLEELIIRRELAENYCYYNHNYDNFEGLENWAKETLNSHREDNREYIYTKNQFENAKTHEDLWNAAQRELTRTGKMHGYMRMYWAKKILEWSESPEHAIEIAIYLNDKYELDGRDPNGYTGIAWSIGGIHDRAWFERDVYGKIRYMNRNGAAKKFDIEKYIKLHRE